MSGFRAAGWASGPAAAIALLVLCLAVYLPGILAIPPIDRDEARFAQASRQMFEAAALPPHLRTDDFHDGGWAVPKVQDRPRLNKPPLIYWLQVASAWLLTAGDPLQDHIGMYRIPSVLGAIGAVILSWRLARRMVDPRAAWLAAALLAIAPVVVIDAHQARADQVLLATVLATQACLWRIWKQAACVAPPRTCTRWALAFWVCLGASVLAKGPIGPMIAALTILTLCIARRQWAWTAALRPLPGVLILAAVTLPWVAMVAGHVGWSNYLSIIYDETIGRGVSTREGHWGPPGYHTLLLAVLFWPGSLMTARALARAWRLARTTNIERSASPDPALPDPASPRIPSIRRRLASFARSRFAGRDAEVFCLAWIIPSWIVFELLNTKLPHYTLPMYPPIAILTARAILAPRESGPDAKFSTADRLGFVAWWMIGLAITAATAAAMVVLAFIPQNAEPGRVAILAAIALSLATLAAVWKIRPTPRPEVAPRRQVVMALAWVAASGLFMTFLAPRLLPGSLTPELAAILREDAADGELASEYHEDSLIFATRGRSIRLNRPEIKPWLDAPTSHARFAIVRAKDPPFFHLDDAAEWAIAAPYRLVGAVRRPFSTPWAVIARDSHPSPNPSPIPGPEPAR